MAKDPVCGMDVQETLARKKGLTSLQNNKEYFFCSAHCKKTFEGQKKEEFSTLQRSIPIVLISIIVIGGILSMLYGFMTEFMGVFFIVVALLKMLDWTGFVNSFGMYDLIANRIKFYAWMYPALELALGVAFLSGLFVMQAAIVTFVIMTIGSIGVIQNLLSKNPVKCACLGTLINIPLTKFTLVEDIAMALMALILLLL